MIRLIIILLGFFSLTGRIWGQEMIGPHGFLTLEAEISNKDSIGERGTFDLHHFNLFGNYLITSRARVFGEIEWEHGTDTDRRERNGIEKGFVRVERAWFEYEMSRYLKLRLGKFLTPYGIYNEIHDASPAYDTVVLPQSIYGFHTNPFGEQQRFYPKFSLGVQILGGIETQHAQFQYKFYLSNGRGKNPFEQDDNKNKGIGMRLLAEFPQPGIKVGYSITTDKNGLEFNSRQTSQVWDFRFEYRNLHFSSEYALAYLAGMKGKNSEQHATAWWGEIAALLFGRQTIFIRYDFFDNDSRRMNDRERDLILGSSIQVLKQVLVKGELHFWNVDNAPRSHYVLATSSLAVTF